MQKKFLKSDSKTKLIINAVPLALLPQTVSCSLVSSLREIQEYKGSWWE